MQLESKYKDNNMSDFQDFPVYDEVCVISDIHMGGRPGFHIFKETNRLAGYID